ncbi:hypothetical protein Tcan_13071 [Toxocara canis]|uniref:Uncharacterized protein n=1 Tax=Toxocara canis TaxID=6265 RepID=A0A0B2UWN1_TOXCA|nr:hypothetical protein Tcan_13071 [Toxocara canis]
MSTAEQMAYEFERGEADVKIGGSGKGRTKLEQAGNKYRTDNTRSIVTNAVNGEERRKAACRPSS